MLDPPIDVGRDHVLGPPDAEMTLVEYGSYACAHCHAAHEVVEGLRSRFGQRMRYVFRHLPVAGSEDALRAAELAEYAAQTTGRIWEVHEALMERGPAFADGDFGRIAREFNLPPSDATHEPAFAAAQARVREDIESARLSGARVTPPFFINGRRYGRVFVASVVWRRRARRDRVYDVFVHRGRGLPRPGGLRGRQDRHLPRLIERWGVGCADPVAETRSERLSEGPPGRL